VSIQGRGQNQHFRLPPKCLFTVEEYRRSLEKSQENTLRNNYNILRLLIIIAAYRVPRLEPRPPRETTYKCNASSSFAKSRVGVLKVPQDSGDSRKSGTVREDTAHGALTPPSPTEGSVIPGGCKSPLPAEDG